jgi:hypothetical protein
LLESGNRDVFMDFTVNALKTHHIDAEALERRKGKIRSFHIQGLDMSRLSPQLTQPENANETLITSMFNY